MIIPSAALALAGALIGAPPYTLPNGLKVLLDPRPGLPSAAVVVGYGAGRRDDPQDRPQLAHLSEHVSADAAPRSSGRDILGEVFGAGGAFNALTYRESTLYSYEIPPHLLTAVLLFEAHRMGRPGAGIEKRAFERERKVVVREMQLRESSMGLEIERIEGDAALGRRHPLNPSAKNLFQEVPLHSIADVRWFLETYYRPGLASLVVIGDFDHEALRALIEREFGGLEASIEQLPRRSVPSPPRPRKIGLTLRYRGFSPRYRSLRALSRHTPWAPRVVLGRILEHRLGRDRFHAWFRASGSWLLGFRDATLLHFEGVPRKNQRPAAAEAGAETLIARALSRISKKEVTRAREDMILRETLAAGYLEERARAAANALLAAEPATTAARREALSQVDVGLVNDLARELSRGHAVRTRLRSGDKAYGKVKVTRWQP